MLALAFARGGKRFADEDEVAVEPPRRWSRLSDGRLMLESMHWLSRRLSFWEKFQCENSPE